MRSATASGHGELHDQRPLKRAEIIVRHERENGLARRRTVDGDRLHIVDVEIVRGFEQNFAFDQRDRLQLSR